MTFRRNACSTRADLIENFFDPWVDVGGRAGQETVTDSVFQNASVRNSRDGEPGNLRQRLRRPERRRQFFSRLRQEPFPQLEALAYRDVTEHNGVNDVIAIMDL